MFEKTVIIKNKTGLHARPASQFVQTANKFKSNIKLTKDEKSVDAKSIIEVLSMGINQGSKITISADGEDEKEAVNTLIKLVEQFAAEST